MTIHKKISIESLKRTQNSIESAQGLPNAAYTDAELFVFERDNVIGKTWAGLEYASALPQTNYALPIDFMGLPLLMVRDNKDEVKVFHNICSHRGMVLVDEAGPVKKLIRCRYHSWSYDLDGELKSTPHIGGVGVHTLDGFSCEGKGLKEVRSTVWMGIVFINLSGEALPFEDHIGPLQSRWEKLVGHGGLDNLHIATSHSNTDFLIQSNWKFAIENYCEAYHLPWVHPDLNSYSPLDQHENIRVNEYMTGQATHNYTFAEVSGHSLPKFPSWPDDKQAYGEYISLYPNVLLGLQVDHAFAIILQPQQYNKTLERLQISYVNEEAVGSEMLACREAVMAAWKIVFQEDIFAVEGMQRGRQSYTFDGGYFSPVLDAPSHDFHKWVALHYLDALGEQHD